jgi:hypothetical protein
MWIPRFTAGKGGPQIFSASDMDNLASAVEALVNMRITSGSENRVSLAERSFVIQIKDNGNGSGGGGSVSGPYRIKSVRGDYVVCRTWDGSSEGSTDIYIAKPWKLRCSRTQETVGGVTSTFTYSGSGLGNCTRTKTTGADSEDEYVSPQWAYGASDCDLVWAVSAVTLVLTASPDTASIVVGLLLIDSDRAWAADDVD